MNRAFGLVLLAGGLLLGCSTSASASVEDVKLALAAGIMKETEDYFHNNRSMTKGRFVDAAESQPGGSCTIHGSAVVCRWKDTQGGVYALFDPKLLSFGHLTQMYCNEIRTVASLSYGTPIYDGEEATIWQKGNTTYSFVPQGREFGNMCAFSIQ